MRLCEDKSYSRFNVTGVKRVSSFEEDYSVKEVVIEPLIGARPSTSIRLIDTDETEDVFVLFCLLPLNFFPRENHQSEVRYMSRDLAEFQIFFDFLFSRFFTLNSIVGAIA